VRVGRHDRVDGQPATGYRFGKSVRVVTGIDDYRSFGFGVPYEVAIALQWPYYVAFEDLEGHGLAVPGGGSCRLVGR
jgi:hypothetical protein